MRDLISHYEQENLQPRSWEFSGEIEAHQREKDGLLQHYIEVDYRATQAPIISDDVNSRIESIVKQRIKDKIFDDVIRTKRVDESLQTYRARVTLDEIERKSLMQMYEQEYRTKSEAVDKNAAVENVQKLDLESESIKNDMDVLFGKLDTLCHSYYRPSNVEDEPKVIINKLAINLEEVGQQAIANPDENLLAPEEIVKHSKFVPKSKEERTKTDRLRQRRKKKKGQKGKLIIRKKASK